MNDKKDPFEGIITAEEKEALFRRCIRFDHFGYPVFSEALRGKSSGIQGLSSCIITLLVVFVFVATFAGAHSLPIAIDQQHQSPS